MNWTTITADDLKALGLGFVIDKARTESTGGKDPVEEVIADAVARVRRAITGSPLDACPQKVPASLRAVASRIALYALMGRLRQPLSPYHLECQKADNSELLRLSDKKIPVERPDEDGGSAEMSPAGGIAALGVPRRQTGRERTSGL